MWRGLMGNNNNNNMNYNNSNSNSKKNHSSREMTWESINSSLPTLEQVPIEREFSEATRKNRFLWFCYVISQITSFIAVISCCLHIYHISVPDSIACLNDATNAAAPASTDDATIATGLIKVAVIVTRVYAIAFNLLIVIHEREYHFAFLEKFAVHLDPWMSRGLFIVFCASLQVSTIRSCPESLTMSISIVFAFLGALYFTMGILCLERYQIMAVNQVRAYRDYLY